MSNNDVDPEEHDHEMSRFFAQRAEPREKWLSVKAAELVSAHQISDVPRHRELLVALLGAKGTHPSGTSLDPDNWQIPRDLSSWKGVREKLAKLSKHLDDARAILYEILKDEVGIDALGHAAAMKRPAPNIPDTLNAFYEFQEIARDAAEIEGKSGNRPHPPWLHEATKYCQDFWRSHKNEEPAGYFNPEARPKKGERDTSGVTKPANAFSHWYCDVMKAVAKLTPSQCETLLRGRSR
jgi:hypothetical protein